MISFKITKEVRRLIYVGLASYLVFLFISVPASFLTRYILPSVDPKRQVKLQNVHGSIWNGAANDAKVDSFNLGRLDWELSGWGLLTGDVDLKLNFKNENSNGNGDVSLGLGGAVQASDVELIFPAETLQPLFYGFPISISGDMRGSISELVYEQNKILNVNGRVVWQSAALRAPQNIELGSFLIQLTPNNNGTKLKITDEGEGPVKAEISIRVDGKGSYNLNGWLQARDQSQQHITEALRIIGRADNSGKYWVAFNKDNSQRQQGRRVRR